MFTHFIAFFAGGFFGIVTMCVFVVASETDRQTEEFRQSESYQGTVTRVSDVPLAPTEAKRSDLAPITQRSCETNYVEKGRR
ncbi:MAG: DUF3789 domain-containing protein [Lachnospiraceae bacterium]|nr:DUF3789 domain-containing protein [Lachnospiraceae bacterium]